MDAIRLADERSLALHREVADTLRRRPELVAIAADRVRTWQQERSVHPKYAEEWACHLAGPFDLLLAFLVEESEHAIALRHVTPFTGVVDPRRRWAIWREVRERLERSAAAPGRDS